jgi:D-alanyl-D-alanine carboxypeptidase
MSASHRVATLGRMTHHIACLAAALALLTGAVAAADPLEAIERHARKLSDDGQFSGVLLVARGGETRLVRAYGLADVETKAPNTPDTVFNIGSINKAFTKVAIRQLAAAGKLSLEDTVAKHLPGVRVAGGGEITLRQLLEHRSGLGDIFGPRYDAAPPSRLRELADFVPLFAGEPLAFAPGTSQRYSNAGYIVLGLIVERVSGATYRDYVARHVFAPAGMTRSGFWAVDEAVANRAIGYTRHGAAGARGPNTRSLPGRPSSAGGAFATAGDLLRFYEALGAGKLVPGGGGAEDLAVAGGAPGINAAVQREGGWTVIALANLDPPSASKLARAAMDLIRGGPREDRPGGR